MRDDDSVTRRRVLQGLGAMVAPALVGTVVRAAQPTADTAPYSASILPAGIRSRFVDNVNGLRMHVLEAGFEPKGRPGVVLLHGFPELAYSWRKVMVPIAAAGYHVIAPDVRGYGRTSGTDVRYDDDLGAVPHAQPGARHAGAGVGVRLPLGGRRRSDTIRARRSPAWCAVVRPDIFRSVSMMSAPFGGPPALPFNTADAPRAARRPRPPNASTTSSPR